MKININPIRKSIYEYYAGYHGIKDKIFSRVIYLHPSELGFYLDGWSELVDNMSSLEDQVRQALLQDLERRQMPAIQISSRWGFSKLLGSEKRPYLLLQKRPGITTTMYVGAHGTDLYVSWRTYIKPVINILTILGLIIFGVIFDSLLPDIDGGLIGGIIVGALLLVIAGSTSHRNPYKYFQANVTIIDAEDITALNLSAHYSLLRALDQTGVDTSKLRIKNKFSSGRKGEEI